eukprot:2505860-Pleurochrysis_carterae.AAC.3
MRCRDLPPPPPASSSRPQSAVPKTRAAVKENNHPAAWFTKAVDRAVRRVQAVCTSVTSMIDDRRTAPFAQNDEVRTYVQNALDALVEQFAGDMLAVTALVSRGATMRASLLAGSSDAANDALTSSPRIAYSDPYLFLLARCMSDEAVELARSCRADGDNERASPARFVIPTCLVPRAGACVSVRVHNGLLQLHVATLGREDIEPHVIQLTDMQTHSRMRESDAAALIEGEVFRAVGTLA